MNLKQIYEAEGFQALKLLAEKAGADAQYLRQCATGWRGKRPSPELAARLIEADSRITWPDLFADQVKMAKEQAA
jgi:hypothetical protein